MIESPFGEYLTPQASLFSLFLATVFIVGVTEEGAKSFVVYKLHYGHHDFDEPVDGIIYGVTVGLGFAAFENLFYTILFGYKVGLLRAVITSLAHASFTGIFGYYLGQAKIKNKNSLIIFGFLLVSFLHGLYDFLVISGIMEFYFTILSIGVLQFYLASLIKGTQEKSPFK